MPNTNDENPEEGRVNLRLAALAALLVLILVTAVASLQPRPQEERSMSLKEFERATAGI